MAAFLIAVAIGIVILAGTVWAIRLISQGPPPEPDFDAIEEVEAHYQCTVCGLQLVVTYAQEGEPAAPKHCREEMVLV